MPRTEAQKKGDALEQAVRAIEECILRNSPNLRAGTFKIETQKRIYDNGVRLEIDVVVTVSIANGYKSTFIFECKNRPTEKASSGDIREFSNKVRAIGAQTGYFVAHSYARDAIAQAENAGRIELLTVAQLDPSALQVPGLLHSVEPTMTDLRAQCYITGVEIPDGTLLGLECPSLVIDGSPIYVPAFINNWIREEEEAAMKSFPSAFLPAGTHDLPVARELRFRTGRATIEGKPLDRFAFQGTIKVKVTRATVVSAMQVNGRGRVTTVRLDSPSAQIEAQLVEMARRHEGDS